jgi:cytochrome c oxidase cbb3-type subunit 4
MDIDTARSIITALALASFLGIVWWAYHRKSKRGFDEAAQLPFADDTVPGSRFERGEQ